ncbi:MAG TPA: ATP-binding protein, partial [Lachnospiraceae bacterium]|nr:ATP-binding protein [Lachnospiraceae bacterium]
YAEKADAGQFDQVENPYLAQAADALEKE